LKLPARAIQVNRPYLSLGDGSTLFKKRSFRRGDATPTTVAAATRTGKLYGQTFKRSRRGDCSSEFFGERLEDSVAVLHSFRSVLMARTPSPTRSPQRIGPVADEPRVFPKIFR
jgi:hypothetical protein